MDPVIGPKVLEMWGSPREFKVWGRRRTGDSETSKSSCEVDFSYSKNPGDTPDGYRSYNRSTLWHELGHQWAIAHGMTDFEILREGVMWENRARMGLPDGSPPFAPSRLRKIHWQDEYRGSMYSSKTAILGMALWLAGCGAVRYSARPDPSLTERRLCGKLTHGENAKVRAFSRRELGWGSLLAERAQIEGRRILLDVVNLGTTANGVGQYCLTLPDEDEYVLSFRNGDRWATVVWADRSGGKLDVELRR